MTSTKETGHAKMVSNFRTLVNNISTLGSKYNPGNPNLQLAQLQTLLVDADAKILNLIDANANYKQKVVAKDLAFKDLKKLSSSIIATLQSSGIEAKTIENAKSFHKKIQGTRITKKPTETTDANNMSPPPKTISTSQQSASQLIQHLGGLISILETEPNYTPNEPELQIAGLKAKQNDLLNKINDIDLAFSNANNKRIERNEVLYSNSNSVYTSATEAKNYIRAVFGLQSKEYRAISKLRFVNKKT